MPLEGVNFAAADVRESVGRKVAHAAVAAPAVTAGERWRRVRPVGQWAVEGELQRNEPSEGEGSQTG